ncbi:hypothetical protein KUTeg_012979 [Tegillarca granosa]|uniref:Globin domain-containing protein n=1 Tax=Tegillarca granosa TaxID=220873 RepID=A0ABQ9ESF5_TEGGR|nr:hypothetical protein KUTeg_012979 [Tegillarca granosa]
MGCSMSSGERLYASESPVIKKYMSSLDDPNRPVMSERQKELVVDTWKIVKDDISKVGVITFMRLFERYPDVQDLFVPFRGLTVDELKDNVRLRQHGLRVMNTIDKCISRLYKPDKLYSILRELGEKHVMFETKLDYFDLINPQLLQALQPTVGDKWTLEVEEAWSTFLKIVTFTMKEAMLS